MSTRLAGEFRRPSFFIVGQQRGFENHFAHGAAASEVEIDTRTGAYRVLRTDIVHDAGSSLNPSIDLGQIGRYEAQR